MPAEAVAAEAVATTTIAAAQAMRHLRPTLSTSHAAAKPAGSARPSAAAGR